MSSPRNHYQPKFLLRGFASRTEGDSSFVWVFRKGKPPFEANIDNVAAERHFHGAGDSLEMEMSRAETGYATLLQEIISTGEIRDHHSGRIGALFANLIIRTRNFRKGLQQLLQSTLSSFRTSFGSSGMMAFLSKLPRTEIDNQIDDLFQLPPDSPLRSWLLDLDQA